MHGVKRAGSWGAAALIAVMGGCSGEMPPFGSGGAGTTTSISTTATTSTAGGAGGLGGSATMSTAGTPASTATGTATGTGGALGSGGAGGQGGGMDLCLLVDPDDGDPCTFDACDPAIGVVHHACSVLDRSVATSIYDASAFLYTGPGAVQIGVAPGTIEVARAAVIRGKVLASDGAPLPDAAVTVLHHPEYGATHAFADGVFSLAVNGGGPLTIEVKLDGRIPSQRTLEVPWNDYVQAGDVMLVSFDPAVSTIDLAAPDPLQIAQGSASIDLDGTRRATLLFAAGTTATMTLADGSTAPLSGPIHVRATEFTVGPNGQKAMPGTLPPASAYTFAAELSIDEAVAAGAIRVDFSKPVIAYLDNFLGFPAGLDVPAGAYDRSAAAWIPAPSGRTMAVLSIDNGAAQIDADGDGIAEDAGALAALGITPEEQAAVALFAQAGVTLWRVPVQHFTPWDYNWGAGAPAGGCAPFEPSCAGDGGGSGAAGGSGSGSGSGGSGSGSGSGSSGGPGGGSGAGGHDPKPDNHADDPCTQRGSIIECDNQILGEDIPITGTPYHLTYRSDRVPGRAATSALDIPISGEALPPSLKRIDLTVEVAGRSFSSSFPCPCALSQSIPFVWDRNDVFGRTVQGNQPVTVTIGYAYDGVYEETARFANSAGGVPLVQNPARNEVSLLKIWKGSIGLWDARPIGLGGFSLSVHHVYDPAGKMLYLGDGRRRRAAGVEPVLRTHAGGNGQGFSGDGGAAKNAKLLSPRGVAVAPDGSIYIADDGNGAIRQMDAAGLITTVAGSPPLSSFGGDGGPATSAKLASPHDVKLGPDGSIYIADYGNNRVRKVSPDGIISTIAGTGVQSIGGDGGPAIAASLGGPVSLAVAMDGTIYVADRSGALNGSDRVRRIDTGGIITTVAGGGADANGEGVLATSAALTNLLAVALGPDGNLYLACGATPGNPSSHVRRVGLDGRIVTVAGGGSFAGGKQGLDGKPAATEPLHDVVALAVGPDGSLYLAEGATGTFSSLVRIRRVSPEGILSTIAGSGGGVFNGEGGPAAAATMSGLAGLGLSPDGSLYGIAGADRLVRVAPPLPGLSAQDVTIPSDDGRELYIFDARGRHLHTRDARTGAILLSFGYEPNGALASVTDVDGQVTVITHDAAGNPSSILAPFGQVTALAVDAGGYLASITNSAMEAVTLTYGSGGLLSSLTDAKGGAHAFSYDSRGRLLLDQDPAGGSKSLARSAGPGGATVTVTTAMGRVTSYATSALAAGGEHRVSMAADGSKAEAQRSLDGTAQVTLPDGTIVTRKQGPDPRFGMLAPFDVSEAVKLPSGLTRTTARSKAAALGDPDDLLSFAALTETVTVNGKSTVVSFDKALGTLATTSPLGRVSTAVLDAKGRVIEAQIPGLLPIGYAYDAAGHLAGVTQGARLSAQGYDAAGELSTMTDPLLQVTTFLRDPVGRVTSVIRPDMESLDKGYDANGNVTGVTPPGKAIHQLDFTPVDLLASYTPPDLGMGATSTTYGYDLDHLLAQVTRPDQAVITYQRDGAGRLIGVTLPAGEGALAYAYDPAAGQLASVAGPSGITLSTTHDGALVTDRSWSGLLSASLHRTYDNDFRVIEESINGGSYVSFGYDADGLVTQAGSLGLARDPGNGLLIGSTLGAVSDSRSYSGYGELSLYEAQVSGASIFSEGFVRDALGRITERSETMLGESHVYAYTYDLAGRLTDVLRDGVSVEHDEYDANGNRLSRTSPGGMVSGVYDAQDRLISQGSKAYGYTAAGELSSVTDTASGAVTQVGYDALGNLRQVVLPDGSTIEYLVDGEGHRLWKMKNGAKVKGFLYGSALQVVAELDPAGNVVSRFVYAEGRNVPEVMRKGGVDYRIVTDHLGSPRLVVNSVTGAVAQRMDYDAWGKVIANTSPGFQPFGFAGGLYDGETGLVRFGARDYDPEVGRWTSKDPLRFGGGDANLYGYVLGDPVNFIDPEGTGPLGFLACLLSGAPAAICLLDEADKIAHGPAGDCANCPNAGAAGGASSGGPGFGAGMGAIPTGRLGTCPANDNDNKKKCIFVYRTAGSIPYGVPLCVYQCPNGSTLPIPTYDGLCDSAIPTN